VFTKKLNILFLFFIFYSCTYQIDIKVDLFNDKKNIEWKKFSLREKVAQMIMVRIRGDFYNSESSYRILLEKWLSEYGIGGVITFGGSIHGTYQNIKQFQSKSKYPLLVAADYERGLGQWMSGSTLFPSNMAVSATQDTNLAYQQGLITAKEARSIGVHITFAPVMDVNNNLNNPIINFRSYSDSPEIVSNFGTAFIRGCKENGLKTCAKHFPGHGNTSTDSHTQLPIIESDLNELEKTELYPFYQSVQAGVDLIMTGHIALPKIDPSGKPASHSSIITNDILRNKWNFGGLIITDGMEMGALTQTAWAGESAIRAVEAGADILLLPMDVEQTINSIVDAVNKGRLSIERINQSVARIWDLKNELGLFSNSERSLKDIENNIGISKNVKIANEIAEKSITVVKDIDRQLPLIPENIDFLTHIILSIDDNSRNLMKPISNSINYTLNNVQEIYINAPLTDLGINDVLNKINNSDQIIVSSVVRIRMDKGISTIDSTHLNLIKAISKKKIPMIFISFGSPYIPEYDVVDTYVCTYGYGGVTVKAAARAIWGKIEIDGKLPVTLNSKFQIGHGIRVEKRKNQMGTLDDYDFSKGWAILDSAINSYIFPGAQTLIIKDNNIVSKKSFGSHDYKENSSKVNNETIYDIASLTKVIVTVPIIMKLINQKKLSLDHSIHQYFPEFSGDWKDKVTIRHLLTHSSGLPSYYKFYLDDRINGKKDMIDYILNIDLVSYPGSKYEYSDLGFILLTEIIENVSKKRLDELSKSLLFRPLQMKNTFYNPKQQYFSRIPPTEVDTIYRKRLIQGEVNDENTYLMGGVSGHAGLFSTASDIGNYAQMILNGGLWKGYRFFNNEQINYFTTVQNIPQESDYAIGWDTPSNNGKSSAGDYYSIGSFGHLGFTGTSIWLDPNKNVIIILLTNRTFPNRNGKDGIKKMYGIRREFYNEIMKEFSNRDTMNFRSHNS
tara:strand:- start:6735 stop:9605 length:2871 start_codon:yes stop_codon:yes gene_type:complete